MAQADDISTYNVETDFDDGSSFIGSFKFDTTTTTVTSLSGILYDSMGDNVTFDGVSGPLTQSNSSGEIKASIFLASPTFSIVPGQLNSGADSSINNAYVTIAFGVSDPRFTARV